MIDKSLLDYIKTGKQNGSSNETIRQALLIAGWSDALITQALEVAELPSAPLAPKASAEALGFSNQPTKKIKKPSVNSFLSQVLAVLLFINLMILANNAISDIDANWFSGNPTPRLIVNALIIVPFLIIAFGLHGSFKDERKKYTIISTPYFALSAWLILRLLFQAGQNVFQSTGTAGTYFALILIIAVVTGIVIFAQKYFKEEKPQ